MSFASKSKAIACGAALSALALLGTPPAARAAINVSLTPAFQVLAPGSDFDVFVDVTATSTPFNGFEIVLAYDPAAVTFVPASPTTSQQGCLMTGACSGSCGNTFHRFTVTADSITVTDVLLCNLVALTGPGGLYRLHFHSSTTTQTTQVFLRRGTFYNDGVAVGTVTPGRSSVGIGIGLGVGPATGDGGAVRVAPNPSFGAVRLEAGGDRSALLEADVLDLLGRKLRHLGPVPGGAASGLVWDGRDANGVRAPAGLYLVRVRRGERVESARVLLLR